jgi:serine/threonine-protein kinase
VPIYEVGEYEGQHYFSMKLIEGRSLARTIGQGPFAVPQATRRADLPVVRRGEAAIAGLMAKVARAVHHAHQHGVLHP